MKKMNKYLGTTSLDFRKQILSDCSNSWIKSRPFDFDHLCYCI